MATNVEIVKKLYDACMSKDFDTVKTLLHPKYTLKDPLMRLNSPQEMIDMMKNCPFDGRIENVNFIAEGDKVVGTFNSVADEPVPYRMRMCSIITLEDGKARAEEMFYDTAKIPAEVREKMKQSASGEQRAA